MASFANDTLRTEVSARLYADSYFRPPQKKGEPLYLLLHGYQDRAKSLWRTIVPLLPPQVGVLAPNGPFPLPQVNERTVKIRFAWYFFDPFKQQYFFGHEVPVSFLLSLLEQLELQETPLRIIGHSQGGYLAPFVALKLKNCTDIIGLGCKFKANLFPTQKLHFALHALHGEEDRIVDMQGAKQFHEDILAKGNKGKFISVARAGHGLEESLLNELAKLLSSF